MNFNEMCEGRKGANTIEINYMEGNLLYNICRKESEEITYEDDSTENQIKRIGLTTNPIFDGEIGTKILIREKGQTKIIENYPNDRKISRNLNRIKKLLSSKNIPKNIIEQVKNFYIKISEKQYMQGRKINNIIIAIYYYVIKISEIGKTFKQISEMFNVREREIKKAFTSIQSVLVNSSEEFGNELNNMTNYIKNFFEKNENENNINKSELNEVKSLSLEILESIYKSNILEGKRLTTITGLSLFLSYKLLNKNSYDEKNFYKYFCSKYTLMMAYEEIKNYIFLIVPNKYSDKLYLINNPFYN